MGNEALRAIEIMNTENGERHLLEIEGMFVAIGQAPENQPFTSVAPIDERGYITAGEDCRPTGAPEGIFVAGDCRTKEIRQVATAVSDGAIAALAACRFIDSM